MLHSCDREVCCMSYLNGISLPMASYFSPVVIRFGGLYMCLWTRKGCVCVLDGVYHALSVGMCCVVVLGCIACSGVRRSYVLYAGMCTVSWHCDVLHTVAEDVLCVS